ncbi:Transposase, partial [Phytophthora megakarya]
EQVGRIFGVSGRTVRRWYMYFKKSGNVIPQQRNRDNVYDPQVAAFVDKNVKQHPCFYVEELQAELRGRFGSNRAGFSASSILRLLKFGLGLSRKVIERRAREAVPREISVFMSKIKCWYTYPEQLLFVDETSKNDLDCVRRYAWANVEKERS